METECSIDDVFDAILHSYFVTERKISENVKKEAQAKSEKANAALGFIVTPFLVTDQNTGSSLYYRELPLPW